MVHPSTFLNPSFTLYSVLFLFCSLIAHFFFLCNSFFFFFFFRIQLSFYGKSKYQNKNKKHLNLLSDPIIHICDAFLQPFIFVVPFIHSTSSLTPNSFFFFVFDSQIQLIWPLERQLMEIMQPSVHRRFQFKAMILRF